MRTLLVAATASVLAACTGGGSGAGDASFLTGSRDSGGSVPIPSDTRRAGREGLTRRVEVTPETEAQAAARHQRSLATAESLWNRAQSVEAANPSTAAGLYRELAESHPDSPRAAEAKFREGRARFQARQYQEAVEALQRYMEVAPTNQHLAEVEEIVYRSGVGYLATLRGLRAVFRTKALGYEALQYVAETFPNGVYADDALLALGAAHRQEDDKEGWIRAVLAYKLLLLRYPESPLVASARLGLGDAYLARDQGDGYHAGFTDLDPREDMPTDVEQAALNGPVKSGAELALAQFEALLADGRATPEEHAAAQRGAAQARERLAAKDRRAAAWYARRGGAAAAEPYYRSAAERQGTGAGPVSAPQVTAVPPPFPPVPPPVTLPRTTPVPAAPAPLPPGPPPPPPSGTPAPAPSPYAPDPTRTAAPGPNGALPPPAVRRVPGATSGSE
jgi:outer membrane protein assembly factor BamD (BamD/ComL family)